MFYTIHNVSTGNLVDITNDMPSAQPPELAIKVWDISKPDLYTYEWNAQQLKFTAKSNVERHLSVYEFLNKFTAQERISIRTTSVTNAALADYMDMLSAASYIDLNDPTLYGGLYYLSILGLILPARIAEILS